MKQVNQESKSTRKIHYFAGKVFLIFFLPGTIDSKEMAEILGSLYEEQGVSMVK